jgi:hypothetical protein
VPGVSAAPVAAACRDVIPLAELRLRHAHHL